jgi:hypothetical protein
VENTDISASPHRVADRLALRELADAYARHVDRGEAEAVAALFTSDGRLVSRLGPKPDSAVMRCGRREIAAALTAGLERYEATTHIVGGQVVTFNGDGDGDGDGATGQTVALAHHVYQAEGGRRLLVMAVRYADTFALGATGWRFAQRELTLDWREDRVLHDGTTEDQP